MRCYHNNVKKVNWAQYWNITRSPPGTIFTSHWLTKRKKRKIDQLATVLARRVARSALPEFDQQCMCLPTYEDSVKIKCHRLVPEWGDASPVVSSGDMPPCCTAATLAENKPCVAKSTQSSNHFMAMQQHPNRDIPQHHWVNPFSHSGHCIGQPYKISILV